jgi:hypothetical protein
MTAANRRATFTSLSINALLFGAFFGFASPRFETNDDVQMMLIASGANTGHPSEFLFFSNIAIGLILKQLYVLSGAVNWYTLYLYGVHFASMVALLLALQQRCRRGIAIFFFALLFLGFELRLLLLLQFTTTAAVAAVGGTLLLLSFPAPTRSPRAALLLGVALVLAAAMIRESAAYLVLFALAPLAVQRVCTAGGSRTAAYLALALVLAGGAVALDRHLYSREPGWQQHRAYNGVRSELHDRMTLDYAQMQRRFDEVGWSQNDQRMFSSWFFAEPAVYSLEKLETLRDALRGEQGFGSRFRGLGPLAAQLEGARSFFAVALMIVVVAATHATRRLRWVLLAVCSGAAAFSASAYLALLWRLPERVLLPILLAFSASILFSACRTSAASPPTRAIRGWWGGLLAALLAALLFHHGKYHLELDATNRHELRAFEQILHHLQADFGGADGRPVFVVWGAALPYESLSPLSAGRDLARLDTIPLSWTTHSPFYETILDNHGISDIHTALFERDDLYLVVPPGTLGFYARFIEEHYGKSVSFQTTRIPVPHRASWGRVRWLSVVKAVSSKDS